MRRAVAVGGLLWACIACPVLSAPGVVTVDGEVLPTALFDGYAIRFSSRVCPPASDDRTRETVVMAWLVAREGERRGFTLDGPEAVGERRATQSLERLPNDASDAQRARLLWERLENRADGYREDLVGDIDERDLMARYRRAIRERHPELVDVPLYRRTDYTVADAAARGRVRRAIESGRTIEALALAGELRRSDPYRAEEWRPAGWLLGAYRDEVLEPGRIVYPEVHDTTIVHVLDSKVLSRVRPYQSIDGDDWHARRVARRLVHGERLAPIERRLRAAARVEEDGTRVEAAAEYPECPR